MTCQLCYSCTVRAKRRKQISETKHLTLDHLLLGLGDDCQVEFWICSFQAQIYLRKQPVKLCTIMLCDFYTCVFGRVVRNPHKYRRGRNRLVLKASLYWAVLSVEGSVMLCVCCRAALSQISFSSYWFFMTRPFVLQLRSIQINNQDGIVQYIKREKMKWLWNSFSASDPLLKVEWSTAGFLAFSL